VVALLLLASMLPADPERTVLEALERAGSRIRGRYADCPLCGKRRKLGFRPMRDDGSVRLHCFGGCDTDDVLERLGLEMRDLFAERWERPEVIEGLAWPDRRRDPSAYRILKVIHDHCLNGPDRAFPSEQTIADRAGLCRRTVVRAKARLREGGYLDWHYERRRGALWRHCVYRIFVTWTRPLISALKRLGGGTEPALSNIVGQGGAVSSEFAQEVFDFGSARAWTPRAGPRSRAVTCADVEIAGRWSSTDVVTVGLNLATNTPNGPPWGNSGQL
jgi:hypothetical protein